MKFLVIGDGSICTLEAAGAPGNVADPSARRELHEPMIELIPVTHDCQFTLSVDSTSYVRSLQPIILSAKRAPVDQVMRVEALYASCRDKCTARLWMNPWAMGSG